MPKKQFRSTEYPISAAHPAADAFPWQTDDEIVALAEDIKAHGQRDDILRLPDGRVIDGRNRELACRIAGIDPRYREVELTDDQAIDCVISHNMRRRDLTAGQKSMIMATLTTLKPGRPSNDQLSNEENSARALITQKQAAETAHVSVDSVKRAKKVLERAPELADAVKNGDLDVKTAAQLAKLPSAVRAKVAGATDVKKAATAALKKHADDEQPKPTVAKKPSVRPGVGEPGPLARRVKELLRGAQDRRTERHGGRVYLTVPKEPPAGC